ncbi:MAG: hypothetical protein A3H44_15015 [Gammaproteobacteria bacterium RIFCSPLOWO2_02_FULL_57_10]|nr:MAG: hypothetical protein A3H44_15015 [Gammaproteobacteria bacterium RIFCSPLOWO2_02_FULL_57_10]
MPLRRVSTQRAHYFLKAQKFQSGRQSITFAGYGMHLNAHGLEFFHLLPDCSATQTKIHTEALAGMKQTIGKLGKQWA